MKRKAIATFFGEYSIFPKNKDALETMYQKSLYHKDFLEKIKYSVEKTLIFQEYLNFCSNNNILDERYFEYFKFLFFEKFNNIKNIKERVKAINFSLNPNPIEIQGEEVYSYLLDYNKIISVPKKGNTEIIFSTDVENYKGLNVDNYKALRSLNYVYLPLYKALYTDEKEIIYYCNDYFYNCNNKKYYEYYFYIQNRTKNNLLLNEDGLIGYTYPVPAFAFNNKNKNISIINEIYLINKDKIKEIESFDFILNEKIEFNFSFVTNYLPGDLDITGVSKKDLETFDYLELLDDNLVVKYNHISEEELFLKSMKDFSKNVVTNIELYAIYNFLKSKLIDEKNLVNIVKQKKTLNEINLNNPNLKNDWFTLNIVNLYRFIKNNDINQLLKTLQEVIDADKKIFISNYKPFTLKDNRFIRLKNKD